MRILSANIEDGTKQVFLKYAWLPKKVGKVTVWLETYKVLKESYTSSGFEGIEVTRWRTIDKYLL